jgi:hypothetical protein
VQMVQCGHSAFFGQKGIGCEIATRKLLALLYLGACADTKKDGCKDYCRIHGGIPDGVCERGRSYDPQRYATLRITAILMSGGV